MTCGTDWLQPLVIALEKLEKPVTVFYRDDDAGWATAELFALLDVFERIDLPLDLAAIPLEMTTKLAQELNRRMHATAHRLGVHQHGLQHCNHQLSGRKCEFGDARDYQQQYSDIAQGKEILNRYFGSHNDPIFTPPWNRCNQHTLNVLNELSFHALSCDSGAKPFNSGELMELPIHIDWLKQTKGKRWSHQQIMQQLADKLSLGGVIGIMLHHQSMDTQEHDAFKQCALLLKQHPLINHKNMRELLSCQPYPSLPR
jgi:peptidoglycan/xylan/chitin deacetylase (PgdA/CDA1 family)